MAEELSRWIYRQLDSTGYSHHMIGIRRNVYRNLGKLETIGSAIKTIYSGSKGEGTTKYYESDTDVLDIFKTIICIDDPGLEHLIPDYITVFVILNTKPGYCLLELLRQGTIYEDFITNSMVLYNKKIMLPSQLLGQEGFDIRKPRSGESVRMTGPAYTSTTQYGEVFDHVTTFQCVCRSVLKDWVNRPRTNDWPSLPLRQSVLHMTGNLVATGSDDSETKHLEWRYCFNEIEMLILEALNDTQLKLYKILKIINTDIFKQRGLTLTSFIMKNIVFWLAETHPQSQFLPETLFQCICETLILLKRYVEDNNIPYYMIPDRNLLKEKVKDSDRPKLIQVITNILQLGPVSLCMCKTFRKYIDLNPSDLGILKQKLEVFELCHLYVFYYLSMIEFLGRDSEQDVLLTLLGHRAQQILRSGWPPQIQRHISSCGDVFDVYQALLS